MVLTRQACFCASFEYGTTLTTSGLADPTALRRKTFPDGGQESYTRNRLGEVVTVTDPRGVVREIERDELGRKIHDRVTNLPSGVDGAVLRLSTAYNNRGQTAARASHDHATPGTGSVVNEAAFTYNAFGQLVTDTQSLEGETGAGSPRVSCLYEDGSAGTIRRVSETLTPGGTTTETLYGSAGSIDDTINRVTSKQISGESEALAVYEYMIWEREPSYPKSSPNPARAGRPTAQGPGLRETSTIPSTALT